MHSEYLSSESSRRPSMSKRQALMGGKLADSLALHARITDNLGLS